MAEETPYELMQDITEHKQAQEERRRRQEIFYQLAHDLARSSDVRTMANHLLARARRLLGADYGFLMLASAEGAELRGIAAYGMDTESFCQERIDVRKELTPVVFAFQKKQPVEIADVSRSPLVSERLQRKYHFVKANWIVPLMSGERAVGTFSVGYATQREATPEKLRLLQLLGDEAALAIERARLTEELEQPVNRQEHR